MRMAGETQARGNGVNRTSDECATRRQKAFAPPAVECSAQHIEHARAGRHSEQGRCTQEQDETGSFDQRAFSFETAISEMGVALLIQLTRALDVAQAAVLKVIFL